MTLLTLTGWGPEAGGWRRGDGWRAPRGGRFVLIALAVAALTLVGGSNAFAASQDMPRLPGPIKMMRSGDSPEQVTFKHDAHVDSSTPKCTACHPREFRILKTSPRRAAITHAEMDKGRYCGACHDGQKAFALDDCATCHAG